MKSKPFKGNVKLAWNSSFRKLRRAYRRNKLTPDREFTIALAMENAAAR